MTQRIDTAGVRRTQEDLIVSLKERARNSDCWCPNSRAAAAMRAALDEIDRLTAALAEAEVRGQRLDRLALRAFTVVEWVVGEGRLLTTPHEDADDLLLDMVDFLAVEDSTSAQASLAAMDTPAQGGGDD